MNKKIVLFLFICLTLASSRVWSWTETESNVWTSEGITVQDLYVEENGVIRVQFSDNTSTICNGANFIRLEGSDAQSTAHLYALAMMAKALNDEVGAKITREADDCRVNLLYTQ